MKAKEVFRLIDEKFEEVVGVFVLAVVIGLIFIGVVMRIGFNSGLPWQEEMSRILYVLVVYLGASYGVKSGDHIRMTFVQEKLSLGARRALHAFTDLIWIAFNLAIVVISFEVYLRMQQFLGETAVLQIPLHLIFLIIPIGFGLITFRIIQTWLRRLRGGRAC
jgi:TRAP-type C4-dicarboxylate transport system permease small subunit